ncbi:MAG: FHA domain-containing protein [Bdellovibrionaceae bacterium]|nr:FHA domain-containing protein [Pseudobdellovibrionaceae bacterium]
MPDTTKNWLTTDVYLEITAGPFVGQKKQAREGLRIGRTQGEWVIKDPSLSSLHAEIRRHARGVLILADLGSKHQINYRGEKVQKVALLPGIEFTLGQTHFCVKEGRLHHESDLETSPTVAPPPSTEAMYNERLLQRDVWRGHMLDRVAKHLAIKGRSKNRPQFKVFPHPVALEWVQGLELGRQEVLGYGPRAFGDADREFVLYEKNSPPVAWVIAPPPESIQGLCLIQTPHPTLVLINGKSQKEFLVTDSAQIAWGASLILVRAINFEE